MDLSTSFKEKIFLPIVVDGHSVPISCLNCSTSGTLHVSGTELSVNTTFTDSNNATGFDGGVFTAQLPDGLNGHIELGLSAPSTFLHTFNLLSLPVAGFVVPGVADAGVWLNISVELSVTLLKPASLSFGFEFAVPKNASLLIDLSDDRNSTIQGLDNVTDLNFNLLPVNISEPDLDVVITAALVLELAIGAKLADSEIMATAGAAVRIPDVAIIEKQLNNVDNKCNALNNRTLSGPVSVPKLGSRGSVSRSKVESKDDIGHLLANFTNIIPAVGMDVSVFVATGLEDSLSGHDFGLHKDFDIFNTMSRLPTSCINNHKTTSTPLKTLLKSAKTTTTTGKLEGTTTGQTQTGGLLVVTSSPSSGATRRFAKGDLGEGLVLAGGSTVLALAVAVAWLVVNF